MGIRLLGLCCSLSHPLTEPSIDRRYFRNVNRCSSDYKQITVNFYAIRIGLEVYTPLCHNYFARAKPLHNLCGSQVNDSVDVGLSCREIDLYSSGTFLRKTNDFATLLAKQCLSVRTEKDLLPCELFQFKLSCSTI